MVEGVATNGTGKRSTPAAPAQPEIRKKLDPIPWSRIHLLPKRVPLIERLLDRGGFSVIYGPSGCCKSFLGIDIGLHLALGWSWHNREVEPGAVAYLAVEGGLGIEERLTAFRYHYDIEADGVPFYVIPEPIDLCHSDADAKLLSERIAALPSDPPLNLIVIDTLSRAMSGGNENSPDDMGAFVRYCDYLRFTTKAHLLVIHHAGKDDSRGARGHSLLKAAADTEIEVSKDPATGIVTATIAKQRDYASGEALSFRPEEVEIGQDVHGRPLTSLVMTSANLERPKQDGKSVRLTKGAQIALSALDLALTEVGAVPPASNHIPQSVPTVTIKQWRTYAYARGISGSDGERARQVAMQRAIEALLASKIVATWEGLFWRAA